MLFNSLTFLVFFILVFVVYWFVLSNRLKLQNLFLLVSSSVFYGWWDYRFLLLMFASSLFGYFSGYWIERSEQLLRRRWIVGICIAANLVFLGFFKYYNFFVSSLGDLLGHAGLHADDWTLRIILPVGISFYTFHNISYAVDVYRKELKPTSDLIAYLSFISFFPQLVAGPIMKAKDFLPQFYVNRVFNYSLAVKGLQFILWGYFKKVVIADGCGTLADEIFGSYSTLSSFELLLGVFYFAVQIYGDFSGYTDIAIGLGYLFGFHFVLNFRTPYFSRSIPEFWQRWHISLTSWFRDYVYIPLGGNRGGKLKTFRNILIVFLLSGLWHGANWTYVCWGLLYALLYIPSVWLPRRPLSPYVAYGKARPSLREAGEMLLTFFWVNLAWILFRSPTVTFAWDYVKAILEHEWLPGNYYYFSPLHMMPLILFLLLVDWTNRDQECQLQWPAPRWARWGLYLFVFFTVCFHLNFHKATEFIYFQF